MPRYAKSAAVRQEESSKAKDKQMQGALCALANQAPNCGKKSKSIHKIANEYGVSRFTLKRLADGGQSMRQFNASKRHFTEDEEGVMVDRICRMGQQKIPMTPRLLREMADLILASKAPPGVPPKKVGKQFTSRFLNRHRNRIGVYWGARLDSKRGRALNPTSLNDYFDVLEEICTEHNILPENKHAMDECGTMLGIPGKERVLGPAGKRQQHAMRDGNRESCTAVFTICSNGTLSMSPTVIFLAKMMRRSWEDHNYINASCVPPYFATYTCSPYCPALAFPTREAPTMS
jgi:hypothetical protein